MTDFNLSKGPKDDGSFFDRNGTLQQMNDVANSLSAVRSGDATSRFSGLASIIAKLVSLFGG